jgi:hypothetical protein
MDWTAIWIAAGVFVTVGCFLYDLLIVKNCDILRTRLVNTFRDQPVVCVGMWSLLGILSVGLWPALLAAALFLPKTYFTEDE